MDIGEGRSRSKYLVTFSGRYGDILWSLPTVKMISELEGVPVDFCTMGIYKTLAPLIEKQHYIKNSGWADSWVLEHECYGSQPWQPPIQVELDYEKAWHLGYRCHPHGIALIDFVAQQQGMRLVNPIPFLNGDDTEVIGKNWDRTIMYSFNTQYGDMKEIFLERLKQLCPDFQFENAQELSWITAAYFIKRAFCFIGCRSSNNVIAHGVGQKNIFIFEPHPSRHALGPLGQVFGCPYGEEMTVPVNMNPQPAAEVAAGQIVRWYQTREQEVLHATNSA